MNRLFMSFTACLTCMATFGHSAANACNEAATKCGASGSSWWRWAIVIGVTFLIGWAWNWWRSIPPIELDPADPDVIQAKDRAQLTLDQFWKAYHSPADDEDQFALKVELPETDNGFRESLWLSEISSREGGLFGRIINEPIQPGFQFGQMLKIEPAKIVDWMYMKGDVMYGQFLTRVMVARAPKRVGRRMMRELGWKEADIRQFA